MDPATEPPAYGRTDAPKADDRILTAELHRPAPTGWNLTAMQFLFVPEAVVRDRQLSSKSTPKLSRGADAARQRQNRLLGFVGRRLLQKAARNEGQLLLRYSQLNSRSQKWNVLVRFPEEVP